MNCYVSGSIMAVALQREDLTELFKPQTDHSLFADRKGSTLRLGYSTSVYWEVSVPSSKAKSQGSVAI